MPTNKNALTRYKYIDDLLSDRHHYYTIGDLTERVNEKLYYNEQPMVSRRCIEKDLVYIEYGPFMAEIEHFCKNGKRYLRYANPSFSIFTKEMTNEEVALLREVLNTLGQFEGLDHFKWLDNFKIGLGIEESCKIISFSTNPYLNNKSLLGQLFDIISNKQVLDLEYHKFGKEKKKIHVTVYPYQLKQYNDRWYLLCSPKDNTNKILNFALDRIDSITPLPEFKYVDCKIDLEERFDDIIGVTLNEDKPLETILFWVSDKEVPYVQTKPIHSSQTEIKGEEEEEEALRTDYPMLLDGCFFKIKCIYNYELIRELSSFSSELLVLSPKHIQDDVVDGCRKMSVQYGLLNQK